MTLAIAIWGALLFLVVLWQLMRWVYLSGAAFGYQTALREFNKEPRQ